MRALLLGGLPLIGKSELATNYVRRVGVDRLVHTDDLRNTIRFSSELRDICAKQYLSIGLFPEELTLQEFTNQFHAQASHVCAVAVKEIQHWASRGQSIFIEGTHLLPTIDMAPSVGGLTLRRYVLMTSSQEQYALLAQSRCIQRYGEYFGQKRFVRYRRLWHVYASSLRQPSLTCRVLDVSSGLDVCLQTMVDETGYLQSGDND
jgi:2-phosphoglycerate kinase